MATILSTPELVYEIKEILGEKLQENWKEY